ncbi:hypothetical protein MMC07_002760 [Pseudocyphellaria aurata]|nr:hypothetical protein [Pseudocyphellaria aurata]
MSEIDEGTYILNTGFKAGVSTQLPKLEVNANLQVWSDKRSELQVKSKLECKTSEKEILQTKLSMIFRSLQTSALPLGSSNGDSESCLRIPNFADFEARYKLEPLLKVHRSNAVRAYIKDILGMNLTQMDRGSFGKYEVPRMGDGREGEL